MRELIDGDPEMSEVSKDCKKCGKFKHGHLLKCYSIIGPPIDHFESTKIIFLSNFWLNFDGFLWFLIWFNFECQSYELAYFWKGSKSCDYCLITHESQSE